MKKLIAIACMATTVSLAAGTAMADSIQDKLGATVRLGFVVPNDSGADTGFVGGGGFIYGITDTIAAETEITHSRFDANVGEVGITDFSLGGQYRFALTDRRLVPYVGAGLDILVTDFKEADGGHRDVDTTLGVHASAGVDYFIQKNLALTAEARLLVAPKVTINDLPANSGRSDHFNPTNFAGTVGIRYFFN